jgi:transposase
MPAVFASGRRRRRHSDEFKANAVAACLQPGISMAAVAMAHGINANLLRRWVHDAEKPEAVMEGKQASEAAAAPAPPVPPVPAFVPMTIPPPAAAPAEIRIELRRGPTSIVMTWPSSAAAECASWLRELLR